MLDVLKDGPFRYLHCQATGQLILTLSKARNANGRETGRFVEYEGEDAPVEKTLRQWKAIARKRVGYRV
jgi:hypothetical protein